MKTNLFFIGAFVAVAGAFSTVHAAGRFQRPAGSLPRPGYVDRSAIGPILIVKKQVRRAPTPAQPLYVAPVIRAEPTTSIELTNNPPEVISVIAPPTEPPLNPTVLP